MPDPADMTDDDLCIELMETILLAKARRAWDRARLRAVSAQIADRGILRRDRSDSSRARSVPARVS